jgi:primosomal protein N''
MAPYNFRIAKVQRSLQYFESDIPLLNMRVKELSSERQESARKFAAAVIDQTRAELQRLLQEQPQEMDDTGDAPCEPAD